MSAERWAEFLGCHLATESLAAFVDRDKRVSTLSIYGVYFLLRLPRSRTTESNMVVDASSARAHASMAQGVSAGEPISKTEGETMQQVESAQQAGIHNQSQTNRVKCVPAGTGSTYRSPVDQITFLLTGEETGGAFFMAEVTVPPGGGNPPHIHHREEETFHLLQGTLTVHVDGKTLNASPGDVVHLPREIVHCFQNTGTEDAKFVVLATPAGLEKFFEEAFYPAADCSDTPPMTEAFMERLLAAASNAGIEFLPPAQQ